MPEPQDQRGGSADFYLPDLCTASMVFGIVLIAELVAIILSLARFQSMQGFWTDLGKSSLFLLWIGLGTALVLCQARPHLVRLSVERASAICLFLIVATTALVSEAAFWAGSIGGGGDSILSASHFEFVVPNLAIGLIVGALVLRYMYVNHQWKRNVQMEARSRIEALQARIRPHFLFNSMNTIAALTRSSPETAEQAVEDLADLFRASLREKRTQIPLQEELEVARLYQRIEQLRLGERLTVRWDTDGLPMNLLVPSLIIQPLLENAIYHGIEPLAEGGTVTISGSADRQRVIVTIANPLPAGTQPARQRGNQMALLNIEQRLELAYQGRASLNVQKTADQYRVTLEFPRKERAHDESTDR